MKQDETRKTVVLAMAAHPDDIEFGMTGTLLLLKRAGAEIHMCNLANGCYGTEVYTKEEAARVRALEAQSSARLAGATWHAPLFDDTAIFYDAASLAKVTAIVRQVRPDIVLTLSRHDYMEDHEYAARLTCSAVFNRCLPCYVTDPPMPSYNHPVAIYHALPHSLMDMLRNTVVPEFTVNITPVIDEKCALLSQHASQKDWLDATQGMGSYIETMKNFSREVGQLYADCEYAEGWRRHSYMGYAPADFEPLQKLLKKCIKFVTKPE